MFADNPKDWKPDTTPITLYNPLMKDIVISRYTDDNTEETYTIPPMSAVTHPAYIANHLKRHLVDAIINHRKLGLVTPEMRSEIEKEVIV